MPTTVRLSREQRALIEFLAARDGRAPAHYLRCVIEEHLAAEGFQLEPGATAVKDPLRGTPAGWVRDHTKRGRGRTREDP